jgi:hypothetical protein
VLLAQPLLFQHFSTAGARICFLLILKIEQSFHILHSPIIHSPTVMQRMDAKAAVTGLKLVMLNSPIEGQDTNKLCNSPAMDKIEPVL